MKPILQAGKGKARLENRTVWGDSSARPYRRSLGFGQAVSNVLAPQWAKQWRGWEHREREPAAPAPPSPVPPACPVYGIQCLWLALSRFQCN